MTQVWRTTREIIGVLTAIGVFGVLVQIGTYKERICQMGESLKSLTEANAAEHKELRREVAQTQRSLSAYTGRDVP